LLLLLKQHHIWLKLYSLLLTCIIWSDFFIHVLIKITSNNFTGYRVAFLIFILVFVLVNFVDGLVGAVEHCAEIVAAHWVVLHFLDFYGLWSRIILKTKLLMVLSSSLFLNRLTTSFRWKLFINSCLKLNRWRISILLLKALKYLSFVLLFKSLLLWLLDVKRVWLIQILQVLDLNLATILVIWVMFNRWCQTVVLHSTVICWISWFQIYNHFLFLLHFENVSIKFFSLIFYYLFHFGILLFEFKFNFFVFGDLLLADI